MIKFPSVAFYAAPSFRLQFLAVVRQSDFERAAVLPTIRYLTASVFALLLAVGHLNAQVKLWGLASGNGAGFGSIFNLNTDGSDFNAFAPPGIEGRNPQYTTPLKATNGKFYGLTNNGGDEDEGVLFEYDPANGSYTVLHSFDYDATGGNPFGSLIESGGKLYGMTSGGGALGNGVLFEYDPAGAGSYNVLHDFDPATGSNSLGSLIELDGKFYGTTSYGGSGLVGVLFEFDPSNDMYTVLHEFQYGNGSFPYATPIESGGKIYGVTYGGGVSDVGVIYEFDLSNNTYTVLHNFDGVNGSSSSGSLLESGGKFYGMALQFLGPGVVYEFDPAGSGTYTVLHNFDFDSGVEPLGNLIESGGKFYGMTVGGGANGNGVLFEYDPSGGGTHTVLYSFEFDSGALPRGSLMESDGKFYGMTSEGGAAEMGVLFEYDTTTNGYTVLVEFEKDLLGDAFRGRLIESGGKLYGTARNGGTFNAGLIFEYDPAGDGTYTILHHFDEDNGESPYGGLTESGGKFYGTTRDGGNDDEGTLFVYDPAGDGTYTVLHHFDYLNGSSPYCHLIESGGKFYGTARNGGDFEFGVLFEYDPSGGGTYTVLHHFDETNGASLYGSLIEVGGKFYGTTIEGGDFGKGVLFEYAPSGGGIYTVLHHFDYTNGSEPYGTLLASGGKFYGATRFGGNNDAGVLFEYDPSGGGAYTPLHHFDHATGSEPYGSLIEVNGKFYGTATYGGDYFGGVVFEYDPAGSAYTAIKHLNNEDGEEPYCTLLALGESTITTVSGKLIWENDNVTGVGNAIVALGGDQSEAVTTAANGTYSFTITSGANFTVTPTKNTNKTNGLTSADVTAIQQHVTNANLLPAPFKRIAADVNKSNSITTLDASLITQVLQGSPQANAIFKTSWRFVPEAYTFPNPNTPWGFPEKITLTGVNGPVTGQDFYGIKLGDVASTWANPANFGAGEPLMLRVQDRVLEAGTEVVAEFQADQLDDLNSFQFALYFDPVQLQLVEIEPRTGLPLSLENFGTFNIAEGEIRVVWSQASSLMLSEAAPVFRLRFKAMESGARLSEVLQLNEEALPGYVYNSKYAESGVKLRYSASTGTEPAFGASALSLTNQPNPFIEVTTLRFVLPEAGEAELRISDAAGQLLFSQKKTYAAGRQQETLRLEGVSGVLFAELVTGEGSVVRKMLAVR